ncbi:hypothetical protein [Brevibacterium permense]|uniref:hypothetical protein n=1 Tax=Brevibacterium permense TaxID=234834 RepID=UPI0021D19055|nr:hypothetical protein [Brevibacterium permense]
MNDTTRRRMRSGCPLEARMQLRIIPAEPAMRHPRADSNVRPARGLDRPTPQGL